MSWYSIRTLEILRAFDQYVRRELHKLSEKIEGLGNPGPEIRSLRSSFEELAAQQQTNNDTMNSKLDQLLILGQRQTMSLSVTYTMEDGTQHVSQGGLMLKITDIQSVTARAAEKDARGNPAQLDTSKLEWTSADPSKISAAPQPDGSCIFAAVGPLTADDQGNDPGVQVTVTDGSLNQVDNIQVVSSTATSIGIAFDQPIDSNGGGANPPLVTNPPNTP